MNANASVNQASGKPDLIRAIRRRLIQVVVQFLILAVILFVASGRLDWVWAWAYIGVGVCILIINVLVLPAEVIAERGRANKENVKVWD